MLAYLRAADHNELVVGKRFRKNSGAMMVKSLDPYEQWLSIPRSERPFDYYRLLGLVRFEDRGTAIVQAAQKRLDLLESHRQGDHAEMCKRVMQEIAIARRCLLDPGQKAKYDAHLKSKNVSPSAKSAAPAVQKVRRLKEASPHASTEQGGVERAGERKPRPEAVIIELSVERTASAARVPRRAHGMRNLRVSGAVLASLAVVAAIFLLRPSDLKQVGGSFKAPPSSPFNPLTAPRSSKSGEISRQLPRETSVSSSAEVKVVRVSAMGLDSESHAHSPAVEVQKGGDPPRSVAVEVSNGEDAAEVSRPMERTAAASDGTLADLLEAKRTLLASDETTAPASKVKLNPPNTNDAAAAQKLIEEVFAAEISKAENDSAAKVELAKSLFKQARESSKDPIAQYVLYQQAAKYLSAGGNFIDAWEVLDELASKFVVEIIMEKAEALEQAARLAKLPVHHSMLAERWRTLSVECVDRADFELAARYASRGVNAARRSRNIDLRKDAELWEKQLTERQAAHQKALDAKALLQTDPNNLQSLRVLGLYQCLDRKEWRTGAALLAKCGQEDLQQIGEWELKEPRDEQECTKLAEAWWKLAEENAENYRASDMRRRAVHWYREALPRLTGLSRAAAEKRIEEAQPKVFAKVEPIVIDNRDAGFSANGFEEWVAPPERIKEVFKGSRFTDAAKNKHPSSFARFSPEIVKGGRYQISLGFGGDDETKRSRRVPLMIKHAEGITLVNLDQTGPAVLVAKSLGVFRFEKGTSGYVQVNNVGTDSKYVVADVVKFEYVGP